VAFTVTCPGDEGALKAPPELIVPALADHITAEFPEPPCTVALHCELAPGATAAGVQDTATDETAVVVKEAVCLEPPHAAQPSRTAYAAKVWPIQKSRSSLFVRMKSFLNRILKAGAAQPGRATAFENGDFRCPPL
jgi:hypothetical protein